MENLLCLPRLKLPVYSTSCVAPHTVGELIAKRARPWGRHREQQLLHSESVSRAKSVPAELRGYGEITATLPR